MSGSPDFTRTPNLNLYKPTPQADVNVWGNHWNYNADAIDTALGTGVITSVKSFGAHGDGTTDDTAAIQAAADAIPASGGTLLFPSGVYVVQTTIAISSNTTVIGRGATLIAIPTGFATNQALLTNKNSAATTLTDHDIAVRDMTFDYGTSGAGGGAHAVNFTFVRNVSITGCTIQCHGAGNAIALAGCYNSSASGCSVYGFTNCAYDWWWSPAYARLTNCYAETAVSNQFVNFNPEQTTGSSAGFAAAGFVLADCTFECTGTSASSMQIEPLGTGTTVNDVVITGNTFVNVWLAARGAVNAMTVTDNVFESVAGGAPAIMSFAQNGGTPNNLTIIGNTITNAATSAGNAGAINVQANAATIVGNTIGNVTGGGNAIYTGSATPVVVGNFCETPSQVYTPNAIAQTGPVHGSFSGPLACGSNVAAGTADLTQHVALYGTQYGFNVTAGAINYVAPATAAHTFFVNNVQVGILNITGLTSSGMMRVNGVAGPIWYSGIGAPVTVQPLGSMYSRTDGAVGTTLYVSRGGGTWAAVAGV